MLLLRYGLKWPFFFKVLLSLKRNLVLSTVITGKCSPRTWYRYGLRKLGYIYLHLAEFYGTIYIVMILKAWKMKDWGGMESFWGQLDSLQRYPEQQQGKALTLSAREGPQHIGNVKIMTRPHGGHGYDMELAYTWIEICVVLFSTLERTELPKPFWAQLYCYKPQI